MENRNGWWGIYVVKLSLVNFYYRENGNNRKLFLQHDYLFDTNIVFLAKSAYLHESVRWTLCGKN